jgi:DNA repair exonuclease SbcCD nuclease subunit
MEKAQRFMTFFEQCSSSFKHVLYIMGNHEHYHGDFATSANILRTVLKEFPNIHFMDKESITIDDVTFIGGTLWTDMNKEDPHTLYSIKGVMNDFRIIQNSARKVTFKDEAGKFHEREARFCPEDTVEDHKAMLAFIDETTKDKTDKFVVIGHHSPCKLSTHPRYKEEAMMNGAYSSDLSEFILDRPQIKLWTHGHTHDPYDYMIGSTRIVCNPRGYINYEECADNFKFKLLEV